MAWTAEDRRKYAPAIQEVLRRGMLVRLATAIDTIDPPAKVGRPRDWSTLTMLGALWHLARDGCVWRRLPVGPGLAAAPERVEPVPALAAARGARPGARRPGRLPPPRCGPEAAADGGDHRYSERQNRPAARAAGVRRPQEGEGQQAGADGRRRKATRSVCGWCRPTCRTATRSPPSRRTSRPIPRCASPGWTSASPRSAAARSSPATASSGSSSAPPAAAGFVGRAAALEGRADLRLPAALPPPARR